MNINEDPRASIRSALSAMIGGDAQTAERSLRETLAADAVFDVSFPTNRLCGSDAIADGFFHPLRAALDHVRRRDEILIGGPNRRDRGGYWIASVCHYQGNWKRPLFGLAPSDHLVFLRSGEFYCIEDGQIVEAKIILDLADLARQAGRFPMPFSYGLETLFPGPATHDGVVPAGGDGSASLDIVEGMLSDLHVFDPETMESKSQTGEDGYWHPDMLWYGPAGIGSNYRWDGFVKDHRLSFLRAFPDRKGGNHYCRIGDGNFAAVSGWPSMTMTHQGDYLGVPASGRALTLRVMDFYRLESAKIIENWVMLDYADLMHQMGVDLIARSNAMLSPDA